MAQLVGTPKNIFWREFFFLWAIAVATAALSIALAPLPPAGLARLLFIPLHTQSPALVLFALVVQNSIHLAIFVGVGLIAAHHTGLGAPFLEAWFRDEPIRPYLRATIIPIALAVVVLVATSALANSSLFRPKRTQSSTAAAEFANSPAAAKAFEEIEKLGLAGSKPYTRLSLAISYLSGAIGGELEARLFEVSVVILFLVQICGSRKPMADRRLVWAAILIVALLRTGEIVVITRENTLLVSGILQRFGLPIGLDPIWLALTRTGWRVIPPALALGLLYFRYGIESSIVANFCAAVVSPLFTTLWVTHFR